MSFLSCIGKRSKRRKNAKNAPLDKTVPEKTSQADAESVASTGKDEIDGLITKTNKTDVTNGHDSQDNSETTKALQSENERLQSELAKVQNELKKSEDLLRSKVKEIHRLEDLTLEMKSKMTQNEAETSRTGLENKTLLEKNAALEERVKELSRMELQSMINQLEEVEKKATGGKTELSGIRTNPVEALARKKAPSQEERQVAYKLSKTELRLSQSEDENKRLREDLKEMLDTHSELQKQLVCDKEARGTSTEYVAVQVFADPNRTSPTPSDASSSSQQEFRQVDDLTRRLKQAEEDQAELKKEYERLRMAYENMHKRLECAEKRNDELEKEKAVDDALEQRLTEQEAVHARLAGEMKSLENIIKNMTNRVDTLSSEKNTVQSKNENLTKQSRNQKNQMDKLETDISKLRDENTRLLEENKKVLQQMQKRNDLSVSPKVEALQTELTQLKKKHDETLNRLSAVSSEMVKKQNPLIRPLSDVTSSPALLAEQFRYEVYGQDWTSAFVTLTEKMKRDEKRTIQILLEICTEAYLFSKRASRYQLETIASVLISPAGNHYRSGQFNKRHNAMKMSLDRVPDELRSQLHHFRLNPSKEHIDAFTKEFLGQIDYDRTRFLRNISERDLNEIMTYIRHCVELCWRMVVQDPPMYLLFKLKHGTEVEDTKFDKYTINGRKVDFVVWPAVFTEEGGTRLQKGVVQPLPERN